MSARSEAAAAMPRATFDDLKGLADEARAAVDAILVASQEIRREVRHVAETTAAGAEHDPAACDCETHKELGATLRLLWSYTEDALTEIQEEAITAVAALLGLGEELTERWRRCDENPVRALAPKSEARQ